MIDNGSDGDVLRLVEDNLKALNKPYRVLKQGANVGFATGHNVGYKETQAPYILLQNPDMYLLPDALEKMVNFLDQHQDVSTVSARLMRWDFEAKQFTSDIDAIGIRLCAIAGQLSG